MGLLTESRPPCRYEQTLPFYVVQDGPKIFVFACRFASDINNLRDLATNIPVEPVGFLADRKTGQVEIR
jgi:hypothetical protein